MQNGGPGSSLTPRNGAGTNEGDSCPDPGANRLCCDTGEQTCMLVDEFAGWGPCLDTQGSKLICHSSENCGEGEFPTSCDAGPPMDAGHSCDDGEFGPNCSQRNDGGLPPPPPPPPACDDEDVNNEPEILAAYSPADGESVSQCGDIKVWVNDEWASFIAPGEQADPTTGAVTSPGDRSARAPDGYLYEPALYIENLPPIFPTHIKGWYNNDPLAFIKGKGKGGRANAPGVEGAPIDPAPPGTDLSETYTTEFVWNLCSLGLSPGTYLAEFVVADGDKDRAIGCVTIVVTP